jgi:hypothetical protein
MWVRYLDARAALDIVSDTVAQANDPDRPEAS